MNRRITLFCTPHPHPLPQGERGGEAGSSVVSWGLALLLFLTPLVFFPFLSSPLQFPQVILLRLGAFFLLFLWSVGLVRRTPVWISTGTLGLPVLVFLSVCTVSASLSSDHFTSFFGSHQLWFWGFWSLASYAIIYLIAANSPKFPRVFLASMLWSSLLISVYALSQRLGWDPFWKGSTPAFPFTSSLGNPNYLGVFTALAVPAALYFCFQGRWWQRLISIPIAWLNFLICALSLTRGAWLGLVLGLVVWGFLLRGLWKSPAPDLDPRFRHSGAGVRGQAPRFTLVVLLVGFIGLGAYAVWPTSVTGSSPVLDKSRVLVDPEESSARARLSLWKSSLRIGLDHPLLGVGLDLFGQVSPRYQEIVHRRRGGALKVATNAHNELLQVFATLGFAGLAAYLWLWLAALRLFVQRWSVAPFPERLLLASLAASSVALQTHAFFNFSITATSAHLWCWWGILSSCANQMGTGTFPRRFLSGKYRFQLAPSLWLRGIIMAGTGLIFIGLAEQCVRYTLADWHYKRGERLQAWLRWESSLAEYDAAREMSKHYYPAYMRSANVHVVLAKKGARRRAEHFHAARDICARAYELFPQIPETSHNMGLAYYQIQKELGEPVAEEGLKYFKRALKVAPIYPEFWTSYANMLELAGKTEEAKSALVRALEIVPTFTPALKKLGSYLPKKEVRFIEQDLILRRVPLGRPIRIGEWAGQAFKLMNLESEDEQVVVRTVSMEETPFVFPPGYQPVGPEFTLKLDQKQFVLKSNTMAVIDGVFEIPDQARFKGKKLGALLLARLVNFKLPAGAYARLLIETSEE